MTSDVSLNGVVDDLSAEAMPDLTEFAEEPGGAWTPGWYPAEIIEGYQTRKGKEFVTADSISNKGDSRNLRLCLKVVSGDQERTMQENFNYRVTDFTPERMAFIKESRDENKGVKGAWADRDAQRSSLAIASLGQIQKAVGFGFKRTPDGALVAAPLLGQKVDVRLGIDDKGYNVINAFAPAGSKTAKGKQR